MIATSLVPSAEFSPATISRLQIPYPPHPPGHSEILARSEYDEAERTGLSPRGIHTNAFVVASPFPLLYRLENLTFACVFHEHIWA